MNKEERKQLCISIMSDKTSDIVLDNSIKRIRRNCFNSCKSLNTITIPSSVVSMGMNCFSDCSSLSSVTFEETCQITSLPSNCFDGCSLLQSITIPSSVTTINSRCFYGCSALESVTIPNSVTKIDYQCFYNCSALTSITIPNTVTGLGSYCFYGCLSLNNLTFEEPCQITSIYDGCFYNCSSLQSVILPDSITKIGTYSFSNSGLTEINLSNNLTTMSRNSFYNCPNLVTISIPSSVETIDLECFNSCMNIDTIYVDKPTDSIAGAPWGASNATVIWNDTVSLTINPTPNDAIVSLTAEGFEQNGNSITVIKGTEVDWEVTPPLITYYAWDYSGFDGIPDIDIPGDGEIDAGDALSSSDFNHDVAYTLTPLPTTTDPMYFFNNLTAEYEIDTNYVPSETSDGESIYTQRGHYYYRNIEKDFQIPDAYFTQFGSIVVDEDTILDIVLQKALLEQNINVNASSILWGGSVTTQVYVDGGMEAVVYQEDKGQGDYNHTVNVQLLNNRQYEISDIQFSNEDNYQPSYALPIDLNGEDVDLGIWWGSCCVPSDSIIKLSNGETKLAKDVMIGDIVFGYDFDNQEIVSTEVSKVSYPNRDHIIEVTLSDDTVMRITKDHAIYTNDGWASYCPSEVKEVENTVQLTTGQSLLNDNNDMVEIVDIKYVEYKDGLDCINLTTSTENYFANGYLVHNAGCRGDDEVLNIYITSK